ncbi:hypothetical protein [Kitasatospora griseola]|uniref:hypothetical protein n=1 Tax=Kitasatospora griseola TaxID=2064 RepID=UPI00381754E6
MKRALALVAVTAALFAAAPLASATTAPAPAASAAQLPAGLPGAPLDGDTSWGGACETPLCQPWS